MMYSAQSSACALEFYQNERQLQSRIVPLSNSYQTSLLAPGWYVVVLNYDWDQMNMITGHISAFLSPRSVRAIHVGKCSSTPDGIGNTGETIQTPSGISISNADTYLVSLNSTLISKDPRSYIKLSTHQKTTMSTVKGNSGLRIEATAFLPAQLNRLSIWNGRIRRVVVVTIG